jgi:16S rRNA (guanine1207-N2)-methyltransferase
MQTLDVPQGSFAFQRHPSRPDDGLRAWDAADAYVLAHLADQPPQDHGGRWLLVDDSFGALATALAAHRPQSLSDSLLAHAATRANLERNGVPVDAVTLLRSTDDPTGPLDAVVVKVPKSLALLADALHRIRPHLHVGSVVVGAGMTRDVHRSTLGLFERLVGPTTTTLARRKARLILAAVDPDLVVGASPYPTRFTLPSGHEVTNHANVFSRERLDDGSRLLLDHLPATDGAAQILDLGCGNGVVGLVAALANPAAHVTFADESFMAIASAQATFRAAFGPGRPATFHASDGAEEVDSRSMDVVVCNPPFHDRRAVGDATAWRMLTGARRVLRPGGSLTLVGNRHLGYHAKLQRIFRNHVVVDSDPRFVVLRAQAGQGGR